MKNVISALILVTSSIVAGQRPSFAGLSPIGFPNTPNRTTTTPDPLADRFGEPEALPIEAKGDRDLIDRLSKLPIDKQPFWYINWQAYDKHRKDPQTFAQKPNSFVDPIALNINSGQGNNGFSTPSPGVITTQPNLFNRFAAATVSSQPDDASRNFNNNANLNNGGIVSPTSNVNPISNILPSTNAYDNSNVYTSSNSNSNTYPNSYSNSNTYPDPNSNWNVSPAGNPTSNEYPNGNFYPNNYPAGSVYPNTYPNANVSPNNYPNSQHQTASFNSNSNTVSKNSTYIQTTQKYQWTTSSKTTKVVPTSFKSYPESYPRTDTYSQFLPGHDSYYNNN